LNEKDIKIKYLIYDTSTNEIYIDVEYKKARYKGNLRQEI